MRIERIKNAPSDTVSTTDTFKGRWYGFRILAAGGASNQNGTSYIKVDNGLPDYVVGLYERRPQGYGPGAYWTTIQAVNNNAAADIILAIAEHPGELLAASAAIGPENLGGAAKVVITDGLGTYGTFDGGAGFKVGTHLFDGAAGYVIPRGKKTASDTAGTGRTTVIMESQDGTVYSDLDASGNLKTLDKNVALAIDANNAIQTSPRGSRTLVDTGSLQTTSGNSSTFDTQVYSALQLTCVNIAFTGGAGPTVLFSIDGYDALANGPLFSFVHSAAQSTGAISVTVGRGLTNTNLNTRHATYGARCVQAVVTWTIAGGPATAGGLWILTGIRGEG